MAIAFTKNIGTNSTLSGSGTTISVTVPAGGVAAGALIVVGCGLAPVAGTVSCADSAGNTYATDFDDASVANQRCVVFSCANAAALTSGQTITVTFPTTSVARAICADEFSGIATTSPLDQVSATTTGTSATPTSGTTGTTTLANELIYGCVAGRRRTGDSVTKGASFTALTGTVAADSTSSTRSVDCEYKIVSSTGTQSADMTWGASRVWSAVCLTYKQAGATTNKTASATATGTASMSKVASFARTAAPNATGTASMSKVASFARTFQADAAGAASMTRQLTLGRTIAYTATGEASHTKQVNFGRTLSYTATGTASMSKSFTVQRTRSYTATGTASMSKVFTAGGSGPPPPDSYLRATDSRKRKIYYEQRGYYR